MKVFLISGKAQNGKDYTAALMQQYIQSKQKTCLIIRFADLVKYVCKQYLGWDGQKNQTGRTLLQHVGTDMRLRKDPTIWADTTCRIISYLSELYDYVLIPDWRFVLEYNTVKQRLNDVTTIRINRYDAYNHNQPYKNNLTAEQKRHISETQLDNFNFDYVIDNWGNSQYNNNDEEKMITIKEILNGLE